MDNRSIRWGSKGLQTHREKTPKPKTRDVDNALASINPIALRGLNRFIINVGICRAIIKHMLRIAWSLKYLVRIP